MNWKRMGWLGVVGLELVVCAGVWAADGGSGAGVLKDKGLTAAGTVYVLGDEGKLLESLKTLRSEKGDSDRDTAMRRGTEAKITANERLVTNGRQEWEELEARLGRITDVNAHNGVVLRMNGLVSRMKEATVTNKGLEETLRKIGSANKTKFVDDLLQLSPKFEAATARYKALADDAGVKGALGQVHATLGPTKDFADGAAEVSKWQSEIDSEVISLQGEAGNVQEAEVLINGQSVTMMVDTGASFLCLPGEMAEKLKLVPDADAPVLKLQLADGNTIEGREMIMPAVRVGRFTAQNVACAVLQKGLPNAPAILGDSFLSHYVVKLNLQRHELQLTEIKQEAAGASSQPATRAATRPVGGGGV